MTTSERITPELPLADYELSAECPQSCGQNVGETERWISGAVGALLVGRGLGRNGGLLSLLTGGALIYRAWTGHCHLYSALGLNTIGLGENGLPGLPRSEHQGVESGHGLHAEEAVVIQRSPEELFQFWRDFQNLPQIMSHLVSVEPRGSQSHWVASGPLGVKLEWDAEIVNEQENEMIAWQSLPGSQVSNAGSVRFEPAPQGRGTVVRVTMQYEPPGGKFVGTLASWFGQGLGAHLREDLRRFKQQMEAGELATSEFATSEQAAY